MVRRYGSGKVNHEFDPRLGSFFLCVFIALFLLTDDGNVPQGSVCLFCTLLQRAFNGFSPDPLAEQ